MSQIEFSVTQFFVRVGTDLFSVIGIVVSLLLLIYLAYRDVSVLVLAPVCALLAAAIDGQLPLLATFTQIFMASVGQFVRDFFPLFLLGALFGKLMEDSGSAAKIADQIVKAVGVKRTVLAVVLSCSILTYGGVALFVVVFAVFPMTRSLFVAANIPRRLIPGTIGLGAFTYTMTSLPGSLQIHNLIPMPFFKTNSFAAPGLGCLGGLVTFGVGMLWLNFRVAQARKWNEGFGSLLPSDQAPDASKSLPSAVSSYLPVAMALTLSFLFSQWIIPTWKTDYLASDQFGNTELSKVLGTWSTILAMVITLLTMIAMHYRLYDAQSVARLKLAVADGARSSLLPLFNTASEYGYGNTIKALSGFVIVEKFVTGIVPSNPLISESIAVNSLAAITGSASGGLSIALKTLGQHYYDRALASGMDPELLHRVASMSCGGLDSLPHNGAVITLLLICGVTHRQGYLDIAMTTVVSPLAGLVTVITLGSYAGAF